MTPIIKQWISPLPGKTHMLSLIDLENFTHKILFQGPISYAYLCTFEK
jgi:hypothetical protein